MKVDIADAPDPPPVVGHPRRLHAGAAGLDRQGRPGARAIAPVVPMRPRSPVSISGGCYGTFPRHWLPAAAAVPVMLRRGWPARQVRLRHRLRTSRWTFAQGDVADVPFEGPLVASLDVPSDVAHAYRASDGGRFPASPQAAFRPGYMTTSSTADIRTWAKRVGLAVGDRGRLASPVFSCQGKGRGTASRVL